MTTSGLSQELGEEQKVALDSKRDEDSRLIPVDDVAVLADIPPVSMQWVDDDGFLGEVECPSKFAWKCRPQSDVSVRSLDSDFRARYSATASSTWSQRWSERKNASRSATLMLSMSSGCHQGFRRPRRERKRAESRRSRTLPAAINGVSAVIAGSFPHATYRALT
jgi:hypothetical protein